MAEFAQVLIRAKDETKNAFDSASRNLRGLQDSAGKLEGMLRGIGIGAGLSVAGLAAFAKSGIDAADNLNDMSQRLGVSVKDLASFKLAAEQSGTSLDGVGTGIARLSRSIGEAEAGNKKLAGALQTLGVTARDPKEAFFQLADAVQRIEDPSQRAALLSQVLGKSYQELVPLLSQGSGELRKSAQASESFAEAMARLAPNADAFNDELGRLKQEGALAAVVLVDKIAPGLAVTAKRVRELLDEEKGLQAVIRGIAGIGKIPFDVIFGDIKFATTAPARIKELKTELNDLQRDLKSSQSGGGKSSIALRAIFGTPEEISQQITVIKNQIEALEKFGAQIYKPKTENPQAAEKTDFTRTLAATNKKGPDVESMRIDDIGNAWKEADAELKRYAEDRDFILEGDLERDNSLAALEQGWIDAGRALKDQMMTPLESFNIEMGRLDVLLEKGAIDFETYSRAIFKGFDDLNTQPLKQTKSLAEEIGLSFTSAFEDAIIAGGDFGDVLQGLEQDLMRLVMRKAVTEPLMNAIGSVDLSSIFSSFTASANGNAFMSGSVQAFASGGVLGPMGGLLTKPTLFPMANGGIGLGGEAGTEAILPLKRGADGKLGVAGGMGGGVVINVTNNASGTETTTSERQENGVRIVDVLVEKVEGSISRRLSRGEGIAPTMERRYGLNPAAGAQR